MSFSGHDAALWAAADRCFDHFPPRLFEDLTLLRHNLATTASQTGQLQDMLAASADEPWLLLHRWLLADLGGQAVATVRPELERGLFLAMLCSYMAAAALEGGVGREAPELARRLHGEAADQFAAIVPAAAPFWDYYRACWRAHSTALATYDTAGVAEAAGRIAPLRLGCIAVAFTLNRPDLAPQLETICDHLGVVFEIWRELEALQRDAGGGRRSPVLRRILQASGAIDAPPSKERLLGGLVFGGAARALTDECQRHLAAAQAAAAAWPALAEHCRRVEVALGGLMSQLGLAGRPADSAGGAGRAFAFAPPPTSAAVAALAAEEYLLSDLSLRESWDVQRTGLLKQAAAIGRPFPAGSIVEILCRQGHDLHEQVSEIFVLLEANRFCYFDQPGLVPPDTDDLGLLLRLFPYSAQQQAHRALLTAPLRLFEACMQPSGAIPVWLRRPDEQSSPFALWGDDCVTVQAQFLAGLLDYDPAGYGERIDRGARYVCARISESGLGANRYYAPLYGLWALSELLRRVGPRIGGAAAEARAALEGRLESAASTAETPQDAALLILAVTALERPDLPRAAWASRLIAEQRYDGSWRDEPLFITGDRGGRAGWYSSRSLTTALCYHALKSLAQSR